MIGYDNTPHEDVLLCACAHPHVRLRYNRFSQKWVTIDSHKGTRMQPLQWILWRSDWKRSLNAGSRLCRGLRNYRTMQHHSFFLKKLLELAWWSAQPDISELISTWKADNYQHTTWDKRATVVHSSWHHESSNFEILCFGLSTIWI